MPDKDRLVSGSFGESPAHNKIIGIMTATENLS